MSIVYALIAINLISIVVCHRIAKRRGANPVFWGVMGAFFGPLAIPVTFLSSKRLYRCLR